MAKEQTTGAGSNNEPAAPVNQPVDKSLDSIQPEEVSGKPAITGFETSDSTGPAFKKPIWETDKK